MGLHLSPAEARQKVLLLAARGRSVLLRLRPLDGAQDLSIGRQHADVQVGQVRDLEPLVRGVETGDDHLMLKKARTLRPLLPLDEARMTAPLEEEGHKHRVYS